jgi:hypothetical protein
VINAIALLVEVTAFTFLKNKYHRVYSPRSFLPPLGFVAVFVFLGVVRRAEDSYDITHHVVNEQPNYRIERFGGSRPS